MADSLRLFALFGRSAPENWGTFQAICIVLRNLPTVSGCLHFLCTRAPKIGERLRLFAFFDTPTMKLADSLRLCALQSRKLWNVSGFLHRHDVNGRRPQVARTCWAPRSRKLGNVSSCLHCLMKLADSLKLFALFGHSTHANCGTSHALCTTT